jgi:hypothetical protein
MSLGSGSPNSSMKFRHQGWPGVLALPPHILSFQ